MIRENKRTFEIGNLNKLQNLTSQPKQFWSRLKSVMGASKPVSSNISSDIWVEHFSDINKRDPASIPHNFDRCK